MKKLFVSFSIMFAFALIFMATAAFAIGPYSFFGGAEYYSPGNASLRAVKLVSDATDPFSGVSFAIPDGTTFADLASLGTDYNVTDDDCGGGSPRFQVGIDMDGDGDRDGNVFVYIGPFPNYTGCAACWQTTGDLLTSGENRFDTSQVGGTFYDSYAGASALVGSKGVTGVSLVIDSSWMFGDGEQTVLVDNTDVNGNHDYEPSKDDCKKGGWQTFGNFKNQGDCVSFFASGGRNQPSGPQD